MSSESRGYFSGLFEALATGWNRFWFAPSDAFTVSVMRVLAGLLATVTIASLTPDFDRFIAQDGFFPRETVETLVKQKNLLYGIESDPVGFSLLDLPVGSSGLWAIHVASIAVLVLFTFGVFSRVTSVLAVIVMLSYHHRTPLIWSHFEPVLVFVMFYLCFAPTGAYCSVDAWLRRRREKNAESDVVPPTSGVTIATRLIQVHLCAVYVMMGLAKMYGDVWWNGTAIWWLSLNSPARIVDVTSLGNNIYGVYFLNAWTHAEVVYELGFPIFIWNRWARPIWLVWGVVMWTLVALVSGLLSLGAVMVLATAAFVSPDEMRHLWTAMTAPRQKQAASS
jgi:uncharacterized membrane protein YphA (DoxX/SURF4 family)